jgi:hypothetical protein
MVRYLQPKRGQENSSSGKEVGYGAAQSTAQSIGTAAYHPMSTINPPLSMRSYPGLYAPSGYQIPTYTGTHTPAHTYTGTHTAAHTALPAPLLHTGPTQAPFLPHLPHFSVPVEFTATGAYISLHSHQPQPIQGGEGGLFLVTADGRIDGTPLFTVATDPNPAQYTVASGPIDPYPAIASQPSQHPTPIAPSQPNTSTHTRNAMSATMDGMMVLGINPPFQSNPHPAHLYAQGMDMGIGMDMDICGMGMGNMGIPDMGNDTNLGHNLGNLGTASNRILIDTLDDYDYDEYMFAEDTSVTQLKMGKGHRGHRAGQHTNTHTHTRKHTHAQTHTQTHTHAQTHTRANTHTNTHTHSNHPPRSYPGLYAPSTHHQHGYKNTKIPTHTTHTTHTPVPAPHSDVKVNPITGAVKVYLGNSNR